ncbi:flagellar export chaperone FliS [Piscinibacter gummiphilus]|uniref:Flagellar secretion chaperone FliS n=1 Tax=Piscinibacter gummiphilus TaxID=946333 RepID=A0A1W6LAM0_9BURK|nr:flagellar export chaperone FliS [Piscinibacter gummiphilus]ARN21276.1 flagellar export chaperone FliS [Piscinibacter gummiphilus]ATU65959.1 flagellar export chaperone FliS [Piscinibacter gummiphilus]GLS93841.1 flagellar protein FliS [Piscinibacter gummiphilus]
MDYDAYSNYHAVNLEAQTARATPVQLVLILMDGLLEELARARGHIEAGRYELKAASLDKCVEILNGLSSSLDEESGGEVVANLGRLYDYCAHRLYTVGLQLDTSILDEVTRLLTTLRSGWIGVQERA